eukprot:363276-Chlamydomonas_euryale.AAC.4
MHSVCLGCCAGGVCCWIALLGLRLLDCRSAAAYARTAVLGLRLLDCCAGAAYARTAVLGLRLLGGRAGAVYARTAVLGQKLLAGDRQPVRSRWARTRLACLEAPTCFPATSNQVPCEMVPAGAYTCRTCDADATTAAKPWAPPWACLPLCGCMYQIARESRPARLRSDTPRLVPARA